MAWTLDAPTGTYRDHALSANVRKQAMRDAQFMRFLRPESGFGKGKGQSVTITRIRQLDLAGKVSDAERLPSARPVVDTKTVTVSEWGQKIELTEKEEDLTHFQLRPRFQDLLRDQMRLTMDKMAADALKATPVKYAATGTSTGAFDTDGTMNTAMTQNIGVYHLREVWDYLRGTLNAPPFRNGKYVGILSTAAARGIKSDSEYKDWLSPTDSGPFITGRMKDVEGFMLYESNHFSALDNTAGSSLFGEAVFFGADPGFLATVRNPELRIGLTSDLGRFREIGWVGTIEAGLTWDSAAEQRVVHVTSS